MEGFIACEEGPEGPTSIQEQTVPDFNTDLKISATSKKGGKIAFSSFRDGHWDVFGMNADGTNQTRLTTNTAFDRDPAWSKQPGKKK